MIKKFAAVLLMITIIVCAGNAFAANTNVLDDDLYYGEAAFYQKTGAGSYLPVTEMTAGEILCQYTVLDGTTGTVAMIAALYQDKALSSIMPMEQATVQYESRVFSATFTVPAGKGYEIRLFLVRDFTASAPIKTVAKLSELSNAKDVTAFSFGIEDEVIRVDSLSNRISVTLPAKQSLQNLSPEIEVSQGASSRLSGNDFTKLVTMTVTAEDGTERDYLIEAKNQPAGFFFDFEDYKVGEAPEATDGVWESGSNSGTSVTVVADGDNQVLKLADDSMSNRATTYLEGINIPVPFVMSCKVNFQKSAKFEADASGNSFDYCPIFSGDSWNTHMFAFEPASGYFRYYEDAKTSSTKSTQTIKENKWYDISVKYYQGSDSKYYADYSVTDEDGNTKEFKNIVSAQTSSTMANLYFWTSPTRASAILIDDILVQGLSDDGCERAVAEDLVLSNGEQPFAIDTEVFKDSTGYSFDITLSEIAGSGEIFSFGTDTDTVAKLMHENGKLYYERNGQTLALWDGITLNVGQTHKVEVHYISDAVYANSRVEFYLDGVKMGNAAVEAPVIEEFNKVTFTAPAAGTMSIENILIEKH